MPTTGVDYEMEPTLVTDRPDQLQAIGHELRSDILILLGERAATTKQLSEVLDRPVGTVGHHLKVLEEAGLIRVVRTRKVRAITEKYYGRTAATFILATDEPSSPVGLARQEFERRQKETVHDPDAGLVSGGTVRYARIPPERVEEWLDRIAEIGAEFATQPADGDVIWGLSLTLYPTNRRGLGATNQGHAR